MARPRNDPGDTFGPSELALAGGMTERALQHVHDAGLLPTGRGIEVLKRIAAVGAFVAAGLPLLISARLMKLLETMELGYVPSGLEFYANKLPAGSSLPPNSNDYWLHRAIHQCKDVYASGSALGTDTVIEIADRRFVFTRHYDRRLSNSTATPFSSNDADFVGWIEGLDRGGDGSAVYVLEKFGEWVGDKKDRKRAASVMVEAEAARANAVGLLSVNISLAVRNALDRIAEKRAERLRKPKPTPENDEGSGKAKVGLRPPRAGRKRKPDAKELVGSIGHARISSRAAMAPCPSAALAARRKFSPRREALRP